MNGRVVSGPTPEQLLTGARNLVNRPYLGWEGLWSRAAATLTRQALEAGVDRLWVGPLSGMDQASMKAQMVCLPTYLGDRTLARDSYATWCALSNACHAHPYDLAPTADELRTWIEVVRRLLLATATAANATVHRVSH